MPRRDDDREGRTNIGLIVGLSVGGGLLLLLVVGGLLYFAGRIPIPTGPAAKIHDRAEFRALVVGKTEAEVIAAVGKPDSTQEVGRTRLWYYEGRTKDPTTGKIDVHAQVVFRSGKVEVVNF